MQGLRHATLIVRMHTAIACTIHRHCQISTNVLIISKSFVVSEFVFERSGADKDSRADSISFDDWSPLVQATEYIANF